MTRFFYRFLIWMHPRAFRERFGDEMLCAFDEASDASAAPFLIDGIASVARQWMFRSGLWRFSIGAAATALVIVGYAHSEANWQRKQLNAQELLEARNVHPLDKAEFNREAAQAVAMLAHYRAADKKKTDSSRGTSAARGPANQSSNQN